jgi:SAM-dependent methyltransferase
MTEIAHPKTEIESVYNFWNNRPCNINHSNKQFCSKEYFQEVSDRKYFVEYHIKDFANFEKYKNKYVLEIGCGIGTAAQSFAENGAIYYGCDLSDKSVDITKKRFDVFGLSGNLFTANIENMDDFKNIQDIKFDLIYSFGVLHHTPNTELAIENIYKMLKPGGEFKLMMYAKNSLKYFEIMDGLDQYEAQNGVPIAKVYTHDDIHKLLDNFINVDINQHHIFPYKVEKYKQYVYEKKDYFESMPDELFRCLEKNLGWHLCITCEKK